MISLLVIFGGPTMSVPIAAASLTFPPTMMHDAFQLLHVLINLCYFFIFFLFLCFITAILNEGDFATNP